MCLVYVLGIATTRTFSSLNVGMYRANMRFTAAQPPLHKCADVENGIADRPSAQEICAVSCQLLPIKLSVIWTSNIHKKFENVEVIKLLDSHFCFVLFVLN